MSTFEKVREQLSRELDVEEEKITLETDIIDDLGADSLDLAELLITLEDEYGIVITDESAHQLRTVQEVVDFLDKQIR